MEARHEIIPFDSGSPIKLFTHKLGDVTRHWHESLELLFVLAGEVTVLAGDFQTTLEPDDMLLINSNVVHELHSDDCVLIAVQIKLSKFDLPESLLDILYFDCNSKNAENPEKFYNLKRIIASMLQVNAVGDESTLFRNRSLAYELLGDLVQHFKVEKPSGETNTHKHLERLNNILRYIGEHYQEQLTLGHLAEKEHLSAPYLSSFFEKYMGINFSTYYTNLRLEHAMRDLLYTDIPVEQIALKSGFSDPRAFVRAFKKRYNMVPSAYRKSFPAPAMPVRKDPLLSINYLDFKPENYFHILSQYLPDTAPAQPVQKAEHTLAVGEVDSTAKKQQLQHKWRTFIGVGRAKELLFADVQDMLRRLQRSVGFRYIRFHGIFSDDMLVCKARKDGSLQFSFTMIDKALDFILSIGLKPLIQFSFMPSAIAEDPQKTIFDIPFTVSPPRRMEDWNLLVSQFLFHIRSRYGTEEIRSWLYSVWNEPDTSIQMFGFGNFGQFFDLYENTWQTVTAFDPLLTFGTPSLYPTTQHEINWLKQFVSFARQKNCMPQFVDIHYYSDNFEDFDNSKSTFSSPASYRGDAEHFEKFVTNMKMLMAEEHLSELPLYITEWNLTVSHRHLINDTCFKATYLVKNFLETYDRTDAVGYWSLTDLIEESQPAEELFHGGLGLFTQNGIRKAHYHAMELMARLGDTLIDSGKGWFITRQGDKISMLLYNYEHFDPLFLEQGFGLTLTGRDGIFPRRQNLEINLTLTNLNDGQYRLRESILNQEHGSAFDQWVSMGAPKLGDEDAAWLDANSVPALHIQQAFSSHGRLPYSALLAPHEVRLVEISPMDSGYR